MKSKIIIALLILSMMAAGCGKRDDGIQKGNDTEMESPENTNKGNGMQEIMKETKTEPKTETEMDMETGTDTGTGFPAVYRHKSESGKVEFDCEIELPDHFKREDVHKLTVSGRCYGDTESILAKYVENGEIAEEHPQAAHDGIPDSVFYIMADESSVHVGDGFSYSSADAKYYNYVGAADSENRDKSHKPPLQVVV